MLRLQIVIFLVLLTFAGRAQSTLDEIYTTWAKDNIPKSHGQIVSMVNKVWGEDEKRTKPIIELQCKSLNQLLVKIQSEGVNQDFLFEALSKWSEAPEADRNQNWWEWPDTNWIQVQKTYNELLAAGD